MIGQTVGNYLITKLLGEGGMGAVYLAEHPGIGRKAAVKVLHPHLTRDDEIAKRFFNEARAANAIGHPGIVDVLDFGTLPSGVAYIVMEFLQGESLGARLGRGPIQIAAAVEIVLQAASALGAAHAKGIVHRDLKPDNLYLVPDPQTPGRELVKVLDFGIAKLDAGQANPGLVQTRTGTVMGTPVYMSPEQCRGTKEVDRRTDIYALGIILYEMLCGEPPFMSVGQGELIHLQISQPPLPPRKRNPSVPEPLEEVVLRALEKDPARRFQTMGEFQQALRGTPVRAVAATQIYPFAQKPSNAPGTDPRVPQTTLSGGVSILERELRRPRRLRWGLAVGGLGLALGAAYFVKSTRQPPPDSISMDRPHQVTTAQMAAGPALAPPTTVPAHGETASEDSLKAGQRSHVEDVVHIEVREPVPPGLQVTVDGALRDLPLSLPRGAPTTQLRFDAPGYEPYAIGVDGSQNRKLVLVMRKLSPAGGTRIHRNKSPEPTRESVASSAQARPHPTLPPSTSAPPPPPPEKPAVRSKLITDF